LSDGQKENRKAVLMQAAAEHAQRGNEADHAPAVVEAGKAVAQGVRAHGCRKAFTSAGSDSEISPAKAQRRQGLKKKDDNFLKCL
jgi:hypothetical protein